MLDGTDLTASGAYVYFRTVVFDRRRCHDEQHAVAWCSRTGSRRHAIRLWPSTSSFCSVPMIRSILAMFPACGPLLLLYSAWTEQGLAGADGETHQGFLICLYLSIDTELMTVPKRRRTKGRTPMDTPYFAFTMRSGPIAIRTSIAGTAQE
ncbi:MAG: hypothetical protein ACLR1V_08535 [Coprococcus sp.]